MKKLFAALAALSIVLSPALAADDSDAAVAAAARRDYYVGFRVAKTGLNLTTEDADGTDYGDRFVWPIGLGAVVGHRFNKNVRMDLEFDYMNGATRDESMRMRTTSALANIYWVYNIRADYVQSYLGAGLGVANLRAKSDAYGDAAANWMFSYQIAVGFNLMLNEYLNVDVGGRFKDLGYAKHQSAAPDKFYTDVFAWQLYAGMVFKW